MCHATGFQILHGLLIATSLCDVMPVNLHLVHATKQLARPFDVAHHTIVIHSQCNR